jgi:putative folate metabolism gamma-glutamate ligase
MHRITDNFIHLGVTCYNTAMIVRPIKTARVTTDSSSLDDFLDASIPVLDEHSIVAITSKVVSLCEGSVAPLSEETKQALVRREASRVLPASASKVGTVFTITNNTLIPNAGIDESNADNTYVLWPKHPIQTANHIREYLCKRFGLQFVGVIITDSTSRPLRRGTTGIALGFSGIEPTHSYTGQNDLFGRPFKLETADITGGLAATAVFAMGEGAEQTPIAIIEDVPNVEFVNRAPTQEEIDTFTVTPEDDLYEPFLSHVDWQKPGS